MFKNEKEKEKAKREATHKLLSSKAYSTKELEQFKNLALTPCSNCKGSGTHSKYENCFTCDGAGALVPRLDSRRVLATIAAITSEYSLLKNNCNQIQEILIIIDKEINEN